MNEIAEIHTRQDWARNAVRSGNYVGKFDKKSVTFVVLRNASEAGRGSDVTYTQQGRAG